MKKRDLLIRIEELERRVRDLEMRPVVYQPIVIQPSDPFQPWRSPWIGDPIPTTQPTITWGGTTRET